MKSNDFLNVSTSVFRAAVEIERCGSISHAAENLYMSQPNLSAQIKNLENTLGYRIFQRSGSGVQATEHGKLFLGSARIILSELGNISSVADVLTDASDNLSIVCVYSVVILGRYLKFRQAFPANSGNDLFKETGLQSALDDMVNKRYRLGFIYELDSHSEELNRIAQRFLLDFELVTPNIPLLAVVSKNHPLADLDSVSVDVLSTTPLVCFEYLRDGNWLEELGIRNPREVLYVYDRGGELEIITHGRHVGISVGTPAQSVQNNELVFLPITGVKVNINQYLMKSQNYVPTSAEEQFLRFAMNEGLSQ